MLKFLQEFLEVVFLAIVKESLLGEEQVSSCQTTVRVQKRLNFSSDSWIIPEFLQEFLGVIFILIAIKSLLCEANMRSRQTRIWAQKRLNF